MQKLIVSVFIGLLILGVTSPVYATDFTATDNGWSVTIDSSGFGLDTWTDPFGADHMYQEWWWGRDSALDPEGPLDDTDFTLSGSNPAPDKISLTYTGVTNDLEIELFYDLDGYSNYSILYEDGIITNTSTTETLDISVFEYTDFDLADTPDGDTAFGDIYGITQIDGIIIAEVTPSTLPDFFEIGPYSDLVDSLDDSNPTTLSNSGSPFGPGDATFAFQWDFTLQPGQSYIIEKTKKVTVTPEPSTILLLGIGLFGLGGAGRLRKRRK